MPSITAAYSAVRDMFERAAPASTLLWICLMATALVTLLR